MPGRIVKQPNGLYARFSSVVDDFTHIGYTREQMFEYLRDEGGVDYANEKLERGDRDICEDGTTNRLGEAMHTIRVVHGPDVYKERLKDLGIDD